MSRTDWLLSSWESNQYLFDKNSIDDKDIFSLSGQSWVLHFRERENRSIVDPWRRMGPSASCITERHIAVIKPCPSGVWGLWQHGNNDASAKSFLLRIRFNVISLAGLSKKQNDTTLETELLEKNCRLQRRICKGTTTTVDAANGCHIAQVGVQWKRHEDAKTTLRSAVTQAETRSRGYFAGNNDIRLNSAEIRPPPVTCSSIYLPTKSTEAYHTMHSNHQC